MEIHSSHMEPFPKDLALPPGSPAGVREVGATSFAHLLEKSAGAWSGEGDQPSPPDPFGSRNVVPADFGINGIPSVSQPRLSLAEQIRIYKEDQLLAHPGGDHYDLDSPDPKKAQVDHGDFLQRIGKDLRDALANVANFFKDLLWGSEYRYVDEAGEVRTARRRGLLGCIVEFFKDAASALSFGLYRPDGEPEPRGMGGRLKFFYDKLVGEAIMDDLVFGVPSSVLHMADDAAMAVWNLLEVVPDATLGNLPEGRRLVTTLFDNGQVIIDYITDCLPTGEAWMRVHAYQLGKDGVIPPVLYNLKLPVRFGGDARWRTIRNTPFRKAIETVGSLLADVWMARLTSHAIRTSKRRD